MMDFSLAKDMHCNGFLFANNLRALPAEPGIRPSNAGNRCAVFGETQDVCRALSLQFKEVA